jgi:hypothetical protein
MRWIAIAASLVLGGCASLPFGGPPTYLPVPGAEQVVKPNSDTGGYALQSVAANSAVRVEQVMGDNLEEHGALFSVAVLNRGDAPVAFGPEYVKATVKGEPRKVIDLAQLTELEQGAKDKGSALGNLTQGAAAIGGVVATLFTGLTGGANLSQAQIQAAGSSIGGGVASGFEAGDKIKSAHHDASDARVELYRSIALQRETIAAQSTGGGYIIVETDLTSGFRDFVLSVTVGGEDHVFKYAPK